MLGPRGTHQPLHRRTHRIEPGVAPARDRDRTPRHHNKPRPPKPLVGQPPLHHTQRLGQHRREPPQVADYPPAPESAEPARPPQPRNLHPHRIQRHRRAPPPPRRTGPPQPLHMEHASRRPAGAVSWSRSTGRETSESTVATGSPVSSASVRVTPSGPAPHRRTRDRRGPGRRSERRSRRTAAVRPALIVPVLARGSSSVDVQGGVEQRGVQPERPASRLFRQCDLGEDLVATPPGGPQPLEHRPVAEARLRQALVQALASPRSAPRRRPWASPRTPRRPAVGGGHRWRGRSSPAGPRGSALVAGVQGEGRASVVVRRSDGDL